MYPFCWRTEENFSSSGEIFSFCNIACVQHILDSCSRNRVRNRAHRHRKMAQAHDAPAKTFGGSFFGVFFPSKCPKGVYLGVFLPNSVCCRNLVSCPAYDCPFHLCSAVLMGAVPCRLPPFLSNSILFEKKWTEIALAALPCTPPRPGSCPNRRCLRRPLRRIARYRPGVVPLPHYWDAFERYFGPLTRVHSVAPRGGRPVGKRSCPPPPCRSPGGRVPRCGGGAYNCFVTGRPPQIGEWLFSEWL